MANRSKNTLSTNFYRNYRVKVYGRGVNQLVGVPWLVREFGDILFDKILEKADNTLLDKVELKFRRGLKVTIYVR